MRHAIAAVLVVLALSACGGGRGSGTTGPSDVSVQPTTFMSGYDGSPIAAQTSGAGDALTVSAPGFLTLDTIDRGQPITLWPNDARVVLQDTFQFVYGGSEFSPLRRIGDSTRVISVVPSGVLVGDPAVAQGVNEINDLMASAGLNLRYVIGGSGQVRVDLVIDPSDPVFAGASRPGAAAYNTRQGEVLIGSRIVVHDLAQARMRPTIAHELVHTLGLGHSVHPGPMMMGPELYNHLDFTELDRLFVRFLFMRQPGTHLSYETGTENDRGAVTSSGRSPKTDIIVCP